MAVEIEVKFRCDNLKIIRKSLARLGAIADEPITQVDAYLAHPSRNFALSDEALRVRTVGDHHCVTYKGPKLDKASKSREEIELALSLTKGSNGNAGEAAKLLFEKLGFRAVAEVHKLRQTYHLTYLDTSVEIALDEVAEVGTFCEIEVTAADVGGLEQGRATVLALAEQLGLPESANERRSYLELLLEGRAGGK